MLGKGLESLIPPKGNSSQNNDDHSRGSSGGGYDKDDSRSDGSGNGHVPTIDPARELPAGIGDGAADLRPSDELASGQASSLQAGSSLPAGKIWSDRGLPVSSPAEPSSSFPTRMSSSGPLDRSKSGDSNSGPQSSMKPQPQKNAASRHDAQEDIIQEFVFQIEVAKIEPNPDQPRRVFDPSALQDMAHSIREFGILQPLVVTRIEKETPTGIDVSYQLIAGERRLMAAKLLGLRVVPAVVRKVGLEREKLELAIIENIQRENLNPLETARAFQRLQEEFRMTQREIAAKMGKSREVVANTVRLLDLPIYVQDALSGGELSESHARMLLAVQDPAAQKRLFDEIIKNGLTTRDVKERVKQMTKPRPYHHHLTGENLAPEVKAMQETLSISLGAPVEIQKSPANNGKITITFYSDEELESILKRLGKEEE